MSYVVLPSFDVTPENLDAFLAAARADARASLADEPGCRRFDIFLDRAARPVRVMFHEVYDDRAAFDAHLETPHLAAFRAALHLCEEGPVQFFEGLAP